MLYQRHLLSYSDSAYTPRRECFPCRQDSPFRCFCSGRGLCLCFPAAPRWHLFLESRTPGRGAVCQQSIHVSRSNPLHPIPGFMISPQYEHRCTLLRGVLLMQLFRADYFQNTGMRLNFPKRAPNLPAQNYLPTCFAVMQRSSSRSVLLIIPQARQHSSC